jgi:hypothetical protein
MAFVPDFQQRRHGWSERSILLSVDNSEGEFSIPVARSTLPALPETVSYFLTLELCFDDGSQVIDELARHIV